jgi:hypothetical protein
VLVDGTEAGTGHEALDRHPSEALARVAEQIDLGVVSRCEVGVPALRRQDARQAMIPRHHDRFAEARARSDHRLGRAGVDLAILQHDERVLG